MEARTIRIPVYGGNHKQTHHVSRQLLQNRPGPLPEKLQRKWGYRKTRYGDNENSPGARIPKHLSVKEDSHLGDFIPDDDAPAPAEAAAFTLLKEQLMDVLDTLTSREEKVLRLRFGLDDGRARTLEEVGKEFNVTRERIRQIEAKALRKLRHPSRSKKLKDYLD